MTIQMTEDNYSDPEGFVDDLSDSEIYAELDEVEPNEAQYEERCLMIFGIPVCGQDRLPKLKNVLGKLFSMANPDTDAKGYNDVYPLDEEGKTKGFCFLEYPSKESAEYACVLFDGYVLDKNHTFSVYPLSAFRNVQQPKENWEPPKKRPFVDAGDLWWWTQHPKALDQFAIQAQNPMNDAMSISVYWNGRGSQEPILANPDSTRENWSENIFKWSPHGSYLATLHKPGIALWAGESFIKVQKMSHENVNFIEFSPNETYLVTYAREERRAGDGENCLRIFDVFTGEMKKSFSPAGQGSARIHDWPFFKWCHNEEFFAFCRPKGNTINVYQTKDFTLCDNKPIELEGLVSFEWNPSKNIIAYYCEERVSANAPAEIGLMEFSRPKPNDPTVRRKIRAQRIFSVSAANLFWQKAGQYLAAHTERYNNARKTKEGDVKLTGIASHLEIFDCTEKEVSVQTVQLSEPFINFGWEPKGNKFCVLVGNMNKVTPLVYRLDKGKPVPQLMSKIEAGIQLNSVEWAPQGGWLTVFGANTVQGHVFFIDTTGAEAVRSRIVEHPSVNQGCWDPTGRYFVTCTLGRKGYEGGYRIHSFQGREIVRKNVEILLRFKWRPRPPVTLDDQKIKEVRKNMKQVSAKFEEEDRREQLKVSKEMLEMRRHQMSVFTIVRVQNREMYHDECQERLALRRGFNTDTVDPSDFVEETITVPLTTLMEPIKDEEE
ncbi:eukaryotic translation initiation factor eIF2A domain-containing protein [Ditylenchus destructor]|uniref:Eukaryotic translation initiation factor 3 subunit B n=1 Tax=Ditylenchus destructor TaxID=166010 RepID=A0AAD4QYZ8_9BILA|nr:eukaryotic translation initiation factor eIF2A domain-containing protein [Ditylenchus destructor]